MSRSEYRAEDAITIAVAPADDPPPSKRPRGGAADNTPAKIFFKTKLCGRFRAGTCNFANCSFAHGMEELRRPPGNWQEEERGLKGRFVQEEQGRARESVAITVGVGVGGGGGGGQKPSNWKTRICNKWETTGFCPFGSKCHFAHGSGELHKYGGGAMEAERWEPSAMAPAPPAAAERESTSTAVEQRQASPRELERWRGPGKISRIYGDWIDDIG
ncbi:zinc finger CCCH domain-containing protein 56-like [Wolffia australiana]